MPGFLARCKRKTKRFLKIFEQQTATSNVLKVIADSPTDIRPVLDAVAENAARLCEADDVQVYQVDGDVLRQVTHFGRLRYEWYDARGQHGLLKDQEQAEVICRLEVQAAVQSA